MHIFEAKKIFLQLTSKKTGNEIWPNVNWKFNLSIYVNLCLFDSSIF
jgi:hypothetical protein